MRLVRLPICDLDTEDLGIWEGRFDRDSQRRARGGILDLVFDLLKIDMLAQVDDAGTAQLTGEAWAKTPAAWKPKSRRARSKKRPIVRMRKVSGGMEGVGAELVKVSISIEKEYRAEYPDSFLPWHC